MPNEPLYWHCASCGAQRLTPAAAAVEAWRELLLVLRQWFHHGCAGSEHDNLLFRACRKHADVLGALAAAPPAETPAAEQCVCWSIKAADPRRHFQGCPLRKPLDAEPLPPAPAPKPREVEVDEPMPDLSQRDPTAAIVHAARRVVNLRRDRDTLFWQALSELCAAVDSAEPQDITREQGK